MERRDRDLSCTDLPLKCLQRLEMSMSETRSQALLSGFPQGCRCSKTAASFRCSARPVQGTAGTGVGACLGGWCYRRKIS